MASIPATSTIDISALVETDMEIPILAETVTQILSTAPFIPIPGALNMRDIGGTTETSPMRPKYIYRSGMLTSLTKDGAARLIQDHNIRTVFDLRGESELTKMPSPEINSVETIWVPRSREPDPTDLNDFAQGDKGVRGFVKMYFDVLDIYRPTFESVFKHIRDSPGRPFLFHCTAGKDRTGVLTALILRIAGCDPSTIAAEYTLTRIGIEPGRDALAASMKEWMGGVEKPGLAEVGGVRKEAMIAFLEAVDGKYEGGAEGYVRQLGFSEEDLGRIRGSLIGERGEVP